MSEQKLSTLCITFTDPLNQILGPGEGIHGRQVKNPGNTSVRLSGFTFSQADISRVQVK